MYFDRIRLYIEKLDEVENFMLLDFISEKEYLYVKFFGDVTDNRVMETNERTMIIIHNIVCKNMGFSEGDIISVPAKHLMNIIRELRSEEVTNVTAFSIDGTSMDYNIFREYDVEKGHIELDIDNLLHMKLQCAPCSLKLSNTDMDVTVFDVGQGSWNRINSGRNDTIFDCGASIYYSRSKCREIIKNNGGLPRHGYITSLIISHWDIDHYNLLLEVTDDDLKRFCCVFVSNQLIGLTAQNLFKRLYEHCPFLNIISPAKGIKNGLRVVFEGNNYILWTGGVSSNKNRSGLALGVYGNSDMFLFPADHSYKQLWDGMYHEINNKKHNLKIHIEVPHHGGKAGRKIKKIQQINPGKAIASTGKNNYQHPREEIRRYLYNDLHFKWIRTDWERDNIKTTIK